MLAWAADAERAVAEGVGVVDSYSKDLNCVPADGWQDLAVDQRGGPTANGVRSGR